MLGPEEDTGVVTVLYKNVGDTDIAAPLLALSVTGEQVQLRPVQRDKPSPQASTTVVFFAQAFRGPGGILPPKASGEITFDILQSNMRGPGDFALRILVGDKQSHLYMNSSDELKPGFLGRELWAPVWRNFLFSVGRTVSSFQNRMTAASTFLSRSGRRVNLLTDLVQFQLDVANGKLTGNLVCFNGCYIGTTGRLSKDNATIESMARADQKTLLTNGRTANESLEVAFSQFRILLTTHVVFA